MTGNIPVLLLLGSVLTVVEGNIFLLSDVIGITSKTLWKTKNDSAMKRITSRFFILLVIIHFLL
ncbi:MAG: hypothetical protein LBI60_01395, partial [Bacteroidales bacterium]|nr:hypothetical protein [Bacteroidales bacterium]